METVLQTKNLTKHYKSNMLRQTIRALNGVSFDVMRGEVFGYVGHNGAGKTTTIKILTGLISATSGEAKILGKPLDNIEARHMVGYLPEQSYFYDYLTAREIMKFYGRLNDMDNKAIVRKSEELFEMLDLTHALDRPLREFSKGMLQRVGVAQAILHDPHLVILDEPMSGLDPLGRIQIKNIIRMLKKQGKTVFFASHILSDVEQLCDRVAIITQGKMVQTGSIEELTSQISSGFEFVVKNWDKTFKESIDNIAEEVEERKDTLVFIAPDEQARSKALSLVTSGKAELESMVSRRVSLEDVYMKECKSNDENLDSRN